MTEKKLDADVQKNICFRRPDPSDGLQIYNLIKNSPPLDLNSLYHYLVFCSYYRETSIIAEAGEMIAGFISGFITPGNRRRLFIWQVVVDESCRSRGIAQDMLMELVKSPACLEVEYLETTVTPSNTASRALFVSFAKTCRAHLEESVLFTSALFGKEAHEEEVLFSIGPLQR